MAEIQTRTFEGDNRSSEYDRQPTECPHCHKSITARIFNGFRIDDRLQIVYQCPNINCKEVFIGYYLLTTKTREGRLSYAFTNTSIGTIKGKEFSDDVKTLSEPFVAIYNQALKAEESGLNLISGIGYRKALEFLIKDYLVLLNPVDEENIKKKFLGNCIKDYVTNPNIKKMAERAVWIGNDETHYTRKWTGKDVTDLKLLIDITVHWIEMELLTKKYNKEMN